MREFQSDKEALDFLVGRIAAEASREGVQLSEVERKMLYFSETAWTLPEMAAVNAEFERGYDEDDYEQKIASLICNLEADGHRANEEEKNDWNRAVEMLSDGDHYIQVMLDSSFKFAGSTLRPPHDRLKLWTTAFAIVFGIFGSMALLNWMFGPRPWPIENWLSNTNYSGIVYIGVVVLIGIGCIYGPGLIYRMAGFMRRK